MQSGDFDQLQAYLEDRLSAAEKSVLQERLRAEPSLREQLRELQEMIATLKAAEKSTLKKELAGTWKQQDAESRNKPFLNRTLLWSVAASLVLLLVCWFLYDSFLKTEPSLQKLAFEQLQPSYPGPTQVRDSTTLNNKWKAFNEAYQNAAYNDAIRLLLSDGSTQPLSSKGYFYLGLCYLYLQPPKAEAAIEALQAAAAEDGLYTNSAKWYLALAYLINQDHERAKISLQEFIKLEDWKAAEAKKLLEALDK